MFLPAGSELKAFNLDMWLVAESSSELGVKFGVLAGGAAFVL